MYQIVTYTINNQLLLLTKLPPCNIIITFTDLSVAWRTFELSECHRLRVVSKPQKCRNYYRSVCLKCYANESRRSNLSRENFFLNLQISARRQDDKLSNRSDSSRPRIASPRRDTRDTDAFAFSSVQIVRVMLATAKRFVFDCSAIRATYACYE